jgi:adenylate cyclase
MSRASVTRRLAAVVIADVAGYSRLMERDDTGTFARLRTILDEVVDPAILRNEGRIVKTAGDGWLAEFPSALAALCASIEIQRAMATRDVDVVANDRIDYRIGVNLGDVMADDGDLAGDGVNVAARLESLAEPGGICVSGSVREQLHGQRLAAFEDIGEQRVKNIERPIRVFRVSLDTPAVRSPRATSPGGSSRVIRVAAIALVAAGGLAAGAAWMIHGSGETASAAPPMSIAILPFRTTGVEGGDATLGPRLTQSVISALTRGNRSARVTPFPLVAAYKANEENPRTVGHALGVRYVAEADLRVAPGGTTVTTRVYDAASAALLSSESTSIDEPDAAVRDDTAVVRASRQIWVALGAAERRRAQRAPTGDALDLLSKASAIRQGGDYSLASNREGLKLVDQVLKQDPDNATALVRRFWHLNNEYEEDLHADRDRIVREMDQATSHAVAVDPRDAEAWHARSIAFAWQGRWAEAEAALARTRELDPTEPAYLEQRAFLLLITGRLDEVAPVVEQVVRRAGSYTESETRDLCWSQILPGRYAMAVPMCEKTAALSTWWTDEMYLAAAYAGADEMTKAREAASRLVAAKPDITIDVLRKRRYSSHPDYRRWEEAELFGSLRKAGLAER